MPPPPDPLADRLRDAPAWRVLALAASTVLVALLAIVVLVTVAEATAPHSPWGPRLHQAAVGLPTVLVLYAAGWRFVLRAPAAWFLAGRPDRRLLGWSAVGLAFPAAVLGLQLAVLDARPIGHPPTLETAAAHVTASLATGLLAGVLEELALRGALLRLLEARWGPRWAVGGTAVVFAGLHQGHAGRAVELALVVASMFAAGLLLALVVVRTRSVWHAVAVHAGWNVVFSGQVVAVGGPGEALVPAIWRFRLPEPSVWLTGGGATLGAAPLTTALLLAAAVVVARFGPGPGRRWEAAPTVPGGDR